MIGSDVHTVKTKPQGAPSRRKPPAGLSITHKLLGRVFPPELDVHQAGPAAPHDHVAGRRIMASREISAEPRDFAEIGGELWRH